jgi:hypothetical protein
MPFSTIKTANDLLYQVIYVTPDWEFITQINPDIQFEDKEKIDIESLMKKHQCDKVFKQNGQLVFVRLIEEAILDQDNLEIQETNITLPETQ